MLGAVCLFLVTLGPDKVHLEPSGLKSDLALLKQAFEAVHPGLYRYNTAEQISRNFLSAERDFAKPVTLAQAYLRLSRLCATLRCGHTYPNFYNQPKSLQQALFQKNDKVPFFFRWIGSSMVVTKDFTPNHSLPPGTEIHSIDGRSVSSIRRELLPYVRGDGANNWKRCSLLQVQGDDVYSEFDVYYSLLHSHPDAPFQLTFKKPFDSTLAHAAVNPLTFAERKASVLIDPSADEPLFKLSYSTTDIAMLSMPTWEMYKTRWPWEKWLDHSLDEIIQRNCKALIVDLRGNEGGNDVGSLILRRLSKKIEVPSMVPLVRFQKLPEVVRPWAVDWDGSPWKDQEWIAHTSPLKHPVPTVPSGVEYFLRNEEDDSSSLAPKNSLFQGKLIVLVDSSVSSATFNFSQTVQQAHIGTVVGEPTGGNARGINGGAFIFIRLPYSKIEVDIPLVGTFPHTAQADAGLIPEVQISQTSADIASAKDAIMSRAMLIATSQHSMGAQVVKLNDR